MPSISQDAVEQVIEPVVNAHGLDLVQVLRATERGEQVLRVLIDREGSEKGAGFGVSLADCRAVSRDLGPALDVHEVVSGAFRLEVSSPGLDRPLVKLRDYERFSGHEVKVETKLPVPVGRGGERRRFRGELLGVDGEQIRLRVDGEEIQLPRQDVNRANVVPSFG